MNKEDKEFDDFFKNRLEDPVDSARYKEDDWNSLEQMMDGQKKRKNIIYWLPVLSAVAALLLLFLGWWAFQPKNVPHNQILVKGIIHHGQKTNNGVNNQSALLNPDYKQTAQYSGDIAKTSGHSIIKRNTESLPALSSGGLSGDSAGYHKKITLNPSSFETLAAVSVSPLIETANVVTQPIHSIEIKGQAYIQSLHSELKNNVKIKQRTAFRPQYTLSVLAAPDINGVGSFQQSKVGTNAGVLFSAGVFKKLTISTGALYAAKPYTIAFEHYQTAYHFKINPVNVTANCRMLDIPLNIGYQLYNKRNSQISIGTGLSSYIMLNENYKFNYASPYATGPSNYNVPNSSKYFFGVLNLNATYQHQLNSKVGISIQPYLKLPLTNLGYSQVRLQTTGVAVGLTWNINSLHRP